MIQRPAYMQFLTEWRDQQIIKVVSGIRRCGKSTLFDLFKEKLLTEGIAEEQIISVNFEENRNEALCEYHVLHDYISEKMLPDRMNYIVNPLDKRNKK